MASEYVETGWTEGSQLHFDEQSSKTNIQSADAVTIAVNGWIGEPPADFLSPWIAAAEGQESACPNSFGNRFAIVWEKDLLAKLGSALSRMVQSHVISQVSGHVLSTMAVGALLSGLALPLGALAALRMALGDCWHLALRRSKEAGILLAHQLISHASSSPMTQPATLIGFSVGSRLVFYCLLELQRLGARGLVENAVLVGSPISSNRMKWARARSVVSGRLVNGYADRDWVLGIMYRLRSTEGMLGSGVAGLSPVIGVRDVENIGLSRLLGNDGHEGYTSIGRMREIIVDAVGLKV